MARELSRTGATSVRIVLLPVDGCAAWAFHRHAPEVSLNSVHGQLKEAAMIIHARSLSLPWPGALTVVTQGQDRSRYRDFQLGGDVPSGRR